ncbi:MAG: N-acetylgalactosamine-6-sulfatase, partial [Pirellula sp.]
ELDGENALEAILGKSTQARKAPIYWRRPPDRPGTESDPNPDLAVRDGRWKAYVHYDGTRVQLFDLEADVSETNNVASEHPDVARRLSESMLAWNAGLQQDAGNDKSASAR